VDIVVVACGSQTPAPAYPASAGPHVAKVMFRYLARRLKGAFTSTQLAYECVQE
jgi:hypothetical protein